MLLGGGGGDQVTAASACVRAFYACARVVPTVLNCVFAEATLDNARLSIKIDVLSRLVALTSSKSCSFLRVMISWRTPRRSPCSFFLAHCGLVAFPKMMPLISDCCESACIRIILRVLAVMNLRLLLPSAPGLRRK